MCKNIQNKAAQSLTHLVKDEEKIGGYILDQI
jgi:hypothetical protein